jgi:DNA-binding NarL/FixJ family response regulator
MLTIKIIIADDHPLFAEGLSILLSSAEGIEIVGIANNGEEALSLLNHTPCDIAVLDMHMPVLDGIQTTKQIRKRFPHVKVLTLTMDTEANGMRNAIQAGAAGLVLKTAGKEELKKAIQCIAAGENYFKGSISVTAGNEKMPANDTGTHILTNRETEILKLVAKELSNAEIGDKLFISPKTVETHRKNMMKKVGVKNTMGLVRYGIKNGLIDIKEE